MANKQTYKPVPFEDRASQNIGVWDYIKKRVSITLLPFAAATIGWFVGKTQPLPDDYYKEPAIKGVKDFFSITKQLKNHRQNLGVWFGFPKHKGAIFLSVGLSIGAIGSAFLLWQKDKKKRLEVVDTVIDVKDIAHLHQTNEDLEKDNALIEEMIAHEREKQAELSPNSASTRFQEREQQREAEREQVMETVTAL